MARAPRAQRVADALLQSARLDEAKSIIQKPIPAPAPKDLELDEEGNHKTTIVLFYQYVEPPWTPKQHKKAINFVMDLGRRNKVTGRGRCAMEGLNCTLTGPAEGVRAFCKGLRDWDPLFENTDFKFTDGLEHKKKFKALTIRKVDELVGYGLEGSYAPSVSRNAAKNLEADEYHKMMADPDAVIIDVRNVYESAIGHFQPPEQGAELIIPPVRNSMEFPKWFNSPETKEKMAGKKVMMYCTGGIRCERATALLDQIEKNADDGFGTNGIFHCRGGIERYMKTFPDGGFWKGKNFLFDRRLEQVPDTKTEEALEKDVESWCSVCKKPWGIYRGAKHCAVAECNIPVIVCNDCQDADPEKMLCPLCASGENFKLRKLEPPRFINEENRTKKRMAPTQEGKSAKRSKHADQEPSKRLFVGNLPLATDAHLIAKALQSKIEVMHWITSRESGHWYGNAFIGFSTIAEAKAVVDWANEHGIRMQNASENTKRKLRINFAPLKENEQWPPKGHKHLDRPPLMTK